MMGSFYVPDFRHGQGLSGRLKDWYFWFLGVPFYQRRVEARQVLALLGEVKGKRILDIGCGDGLFALELARKGAQVVGLDTSPSVLSRGAHRAQALRLERAFFLHGNATTMALASSAFDLTVCNCVLEHIAADGEVLRDIYRVLKPGGKLVLTVPRDYQTQRRIPFRLVRLLLHMPGPIKRAVGSPALKKARSFEEYAQANLQQYDHARFGYSDDDINARLSQAGFQVLARQGYFRSFGVLGLDIMEGTRFFQVERSGVFGYSSRYEWLFGLLFPLFFGLSLLDALLPSRAPSIGIVVSARKPSSGG